MLPRVFEQAPEASTRRPALLPALMLRLAHFRRDLAELRVEQRPDLLDHVRQITSGRRLDRLDSRVPSIRPAYSRRLHIRRLCHRAVLDHVDDRATLRWLRSQLARRQSTND